MPTEPTMVLQAIIRVTVLLLFGLLALRGINDE